MHLARGAERGIERLMERVAGFIFPGQLHPNELGAKLVRAADLRLRSSRYGDEAPNWFQILVNPEELTTDLPVRALRSALATALEEHSAERGWRLVGPVDVVFELNSQISRGKVSVVVEHRRGLRPAWATLRWEMGDLPVSNNRAVLGRGAECDVEIGDDTVSRVHALLYRENQTIWLKDLGSANGTFIQGRRVGSPCEVQEGDVIMLGSISLQLLVSGETGVTT